MLFESTATKVTSARPIISAAAVAAVRPGSAACCDAPGSRDAGKPLAGTPTTAAIGRTSFDEIIATPTKSRRTPKAIESRRGPMPSSSVNAARRAAGARRPG